MADRLLGWRADAIAASSRRQTSVAGAEAQKIYCKGEPSRCDNDAMTYLLPPLNALRAFEAAARHLSFKLAAHELHVTPGAISQQVKALEDRLGIRLFERLHKQLILTAAGQAYLPALRDGFRRIADATMRLQPDGITLMLTLGVHGRFEVTRLGLERFRGAHPAIGLRVVHPAGLHELDDGKVDLLITRGLGHHPRCRSDRLDAARADVGDFLICPEGIAACPEVETLRAWLLAAAAAARPQLVRAAG
jgi:LysR family glycine cleavage system transcriptional activator